MAATRKMRPKINAISGDNRVKASYTVGVPVVTYCRISADKTGAGLGVERQAADCRDLALRLGLVSPKCSPITIFPPTRQTPARLRAKLKKGLKEGRWSTLLIWHVAGSAEAYAILKTSLTWSTARLPYTPSKVARLILKHRRGRLQARMLGTLARYESEHRSDRVRRALQQSADLGRNHGGPRPYGWNPDATLSHGEAAIIAEPDPPHQRRVADHWRPSYVLEVCHPPVVHHGLHTRSGKS